MERLQVLYKAFRNGDAAMNNNLHDFSLLEFARDRTDEATRALAGVIVSGNDSQKGVPSFEMSLGEKAFAQLMERYFPGVLGVVVQFQCRQAGEQKPPASSQSEFPELLCLLLEHGVPENEQQETLWLAYAVAVASLGGNHLWQDMGLPSRKALSSLLKRYFQPLYNKNTKDMKWKKFFYKQLCEREGMSLCKSPNCEDCADYAHCFGQE